jgi:6-phosphofructokinase
MVVEVMGRHTGWIATHAGIAGGATAVLIPEIPFDIGELCDRLSRRHDRGRYASIVVVAEGAEPIEGTLEMEEKVYDRFGHVVLGGVATRIARVIGERTGFETRVVQLGHVQRGGTPTAFDRVLSTRFGVAAIDAVHQGAWGKMTVVRGDRIELDDLTVAVDKTRTVDMELFHDVAEHFSA